jgi:hypothetical protein
MAQYPKDMAMLLTEIELTTDPERRAALLLQFSKRTAQRAKEAAKKPKKVKSKYRPSQTAPSTTDWGKKIGG